MAAWNIKEDDSRTADSIVTFIVFCEDEICEVLYLKQFETAITKVNLIGKQKGSITNVLNAITHCQKNGLLIRDQNQVEKLADNATRVWCVFDRDRNAGATEQLEANAFNESITLANSKGFKVAWSNDAFELWLLLHFEAIDPNNNPYPAREDCYNRLTQIFLPLQSDNAALKRVQAEPTFRYKTFLKTRKNFPSIVMPATTQLIGEAINRAKVLEAYHDVAAKVPSDKNPCTMMHHLVAELMKHAQDLTK